MNSLSSPVSTSSRWMPNAGSTNVAKIEDLVLQSLEHELAGVALYTTALRCVVRADLRTEWESYLAQTRTHVASLARVCAILGIDAKRETAGRRLVRRTGEVLIRAMELALQSGDKKAMQIVACECVVLAEAKEQLDWRLLSKCAGRLTAEGAKELKRACEEIQDPNEEPLYHSKAWCRELWIESLGMHPVLPAPQEPKQIKAPASRRNYRARVSVSA